MMFDSDGNYNDYCFAHQQQEGWLLLLGPAFLDQFATGWWWFPDECARGVSVTTTVGALRCCLFLSVVIFLWAAVLLQGTVMELGIVYCQKTLDGWKGILTKTCRRLF